MENTENAPKTFMSFKERVEQSTQLKGMFQTVTCRNCPSTYPVLKSMMGVAELFERHTYCRRCRVKREQFAFRTIFDDVEE